MKSERVYAGCACGYSTVSTGDPVKALKRVSKLLSAHRCYPPGTVEPPYRVGVFVGYA